MYNLITFTTVDTLRKCAFQWSTVVDMSLHLCIKKLAEFMRESFDGQIPQALEETLSHHFPEFMGDQLRAFLSGHRFTQEKMWCADYVNSSTKFSFLELLLQQPELVPFFDRFPKALLELGLFNQPWKIPLEEDNRRAFDLLAPRMTMHREPFPHIPRFFEHHLDPPNRYLYRFSAAAAAIRFLESLDPSTRAYLRPILLDEDRQSVAHPERHGQGLEHFCRDNPLLRVERRVNMWTTLFPQQEHCPPLDYLSVNYISDGNQSRWFHCASPLGSESCLVGLDWLVLGWFKFLEMDRFDEHFSPHFSKVIAAWTAEALNLHSSITLVIDGDPIARHSSDVFESSLSLEQCFESRRLPCPRSWTWVAAGERPRMANDWFVFTLEGCVLDRFPSMIKKLADGSYSGVRLNFPVRGSEHLDQQVEAMLLEHGDWDYKQWMKAWEDRFDGRAVKPVLPLATNWSEIFEGDLMPKPEGRETLWWEEYDDPWDDPLDDEV
ncbi:hypothetical protein V8F33_005624 [Rhypophila sp. PSN 637]